MPDEIIRFCDYCHPKRREAVAMFDRTLVPLDLKSGQVTGGATKTRVRVCTPCLTKHVDGTQMQLGDSTTAYRTDRSDGEGRTETQVKPSASAARLTDSDVVCIGKTGCQEAVPYPRRQDHARHEHRGKRPEELQWALPEGVAVHRCTKDGCTAGDPEGYPLSDDGRAIATHERARHPA